MRCIRQSKFRFSVITLECLILFMFFVSVCPHTALGIEKSQVLQGAQQGNMDDAYFLGVMYRTGSGVSADCHESFEWTSQAAKQGHTLAQSHLGVLFRYGCGDQLTQDLSKAYYWTALAANRGLQFAEDNRDELEKMLHPYVINELQRQIEAYKQTTPN